MHVAWEACRVRGAGVSCRDDGSSSTARDRQRFTRGVAAESLVDWRARGWRRRRRGHSRRALEQPTE